MEGGERDKREGEREGQAWRMRMRHTYRTD